MPRTVSVAKIVVDAPQVSARRRREVVKWLIAKANDLSSTGSNWNEDGPVRLHNHALGGYAISTATFKCPGALSHETRQRIAKWMLSRAEWVRKHGAGHDRRWFVQEFAL